MAPQDMACLDGLFILQFTKEEIESAWLKLVLHMQGDPSFIRYTRCIDHYSALREDTVLVHIHTKRNCYQCINNE